MMFHPLRQSLYSVDRDGAGQAEASGQGSINSVDGQGDAVPEHPESAGSGAIARPAMTTDAAAIIPALSRTAQMPVAFDQLAVSVAVCAVQPAEFPGGDMALIAVCQAINDLVAQGAAPLSIAAGITVIAGTSAAAMDQILSGLVRAASGAGVQLLAADLNGAASVSLNTSAAGWPKCRRSSGTLSITVTAFGQRGVLQPSIQRVSPGDILICGGGLGHHGLVVQMARCLPHLPCALRSDVAPLHDCLPILESFAQGISWMRPCAAGGLAGAVNQLASAIDRCVILDESTLDISAEALQAADMLGVDPLDAANAGKMLWVVRPEVARPLIDQLSNHPLYRDLRIIGQVSGDKGGQCQMHTRLGGWRRIHAPGHDAVLGAD